MKISELSPDLNRSSGDRSFTDLESLIISTESFSSSPSPPSLTILAASHRRQLSHLSSLAPFPDAAQLRLWKLSFRLWNACVDIFNFNPGQNIALAEIRQCAADLLLIAGISSEIPSSKIKAASFLRRTGLIWHELGQLDRASECFEKATDMVDAATGDEEERQLALDLNLARSQIAWENSDKTLAIALLNRSKSFLSGSVHSDAYKSLAEQYLSYGKLLLANKEGKQNPNPNTSPTSSDLFSEALDICEKALTTIAMTKDSELQSLKQRCLRFLSAERLQNEDYEGVLKCVRVLRNSPHTPENPHEHPSVGYVAMKGWLGVKNVKEAERELMGLVRNKEAPEAVVVSASEEYLGFAGVEAARAVMVALAGRCRVGGAQAAVRVVKRVLEGGVGGGKGRARAAAELVADQRVVTLFEGEEKGRERSAMHALLWNCGAEHFRMQNVEISADLFERSMLYVLRDEENRSRRANCFRVLSLCHLALSQLDQAQEFINQADKLEPSIKCAFIKFKIHLKKGEEGEAIKLLQSMMTYADFHPEFLTISTHESLQNKFPKIAIVSLSTLLSLYTPNKPMPVPEVSVLRNLTTLLLRETGTESEILKYLKLVRTHMNEIGMQSFGFREISWFAGNCWNLGLKMGKEMRYELCKEFLELGADFYGVNVGNESDNNNKEMTCKCLVLSVGAMLSLEENKKGNLSDFDVKKGIEMLDRAGKLLPSISPDQSNSFHFLHIYYSYQLLNEPNSNPNPQIQQTQLIKNYASTKHCTPNHLLQLALIASQNPNPNIDAAEFAFKSSLSSFLSSPSPNYQSISTILRKLINISSYNDDMAFEVYKKAYNIIVGLKEGEYPIEEGKWLAMSAWNRSGLSVRLRQGEIARKWMKLGLDFARRLKGMESYVKGMEECLENFGKVCDEREGGESASNNKQLVLV